MCRRWSALRGPVGRDPVGDRRYRYGDDDDRHDDDRAAASADDYDHDDYDDDDTTPTVPRPTTIAAGVTVAGEVLVGGLSPAAGDRCGESVLRAAA